MLMPAMLAALNELMPPTLPTMSKMMAVNASTTFAKAPPMMKATASSTKLPRIRKSLKPFIGFLSRGRRWPRIGDGELRRQQ